MASTTSQPVTFTFSDSPYPSATGAPGQRSGYDGRVIASAFHGLTMAVSFCVVLPLGATIIRAPIIRTWLLVHRAVQFAGMLIALLGAILGLTIKFSYNSEVIHDTLTAIHGLIIVFSGRRAKSSSGDRRIPCLVSLCQSLASSSIPETQQSTKTKGTV